MRRYSLAIAIAFGLHVMAALVSKSYFRFLAGVGASVVHRSDIADLPEVALLGFSVVAGVLVIAAAGVAYLTGHPPTHPTRVWLKRIAIAVGSLLVLLAALLALLIHGLSQPRETKLGGNWIMSEPQSLVIDSGPRPRFLQRVRGRERVTVTDKPSSVVYIGDDCILFVEWVAELQHAQPNEHYAIKAACADRQPIVVGHSPDYVTRDALEPDTVRINGKKIPWAEIRQHAERGESLVE